MYSVSELVGNGPEAGLVHEAIQRDINPANVIGVDGSLIRLMVTRLGLANSIPRLVEDPQSVTPSEFQALALGRIIRTGFDANIVRLNGNGLYTVNAEKIKNNVVHFRDLPKGTREQLRASQAMADRIKDEVIAQIPSDVLAAKRSQKRYNQKFVHAAYIMGKMAYAGVDERQSGGLYIEHPERVAATADHVLDLVQAAMRIEHSKFTIPAGMRAAFIVCAILHDALEEWRKPATYYSDAAGGNTWNPNNDVLTPMVIKTTMVALGMGEGAADYLANAIRLLTHEKDGDWMLTFAQYLYRGSGSRLTLPTKLFDMFDNLTTDPKPAPKFKPEMTAKKYIKKTLYWDYHRGEYYYYVYEDGLRAITYEKNALNVDSALSPMAGAMVAVVSGLAYPDKPPSELIGPDGEVIREIDRNTEQGDRMLGSEFRRTEIPKLLRRLSGKWALELVAA